MFDIYELKSLAQTVLHATSKILKDADVIIVDQNGNYLTKDSSYELRKKTGEWKPYIDEIIRRKEITIIENPGFNELCKGCENEGCCPQKLEISVPFNVEDKFIGYMSVVSFSEETKEEFLNNKEDIITYIYTMINILVSASKEHFEKKKSEEMFLELEAISNSMSYGVVDCFVDGSIKYFNNAFNDFIGTNERLINQPVNKFISSKVVEEVLKNNCAMDEQEDIISASGVSYRMWVKTIPIKNEKDEIISYVFFFRHSEEIRELLYNHNNEFIDDPLEQIVGGCASTVELKDRIKLIANSSSTVLVKGETGTGKELVARAIHLCGERKNKPFVTINCAAIPDNLLESELFGYEDGAFTGAKKGGKPGLFEIANTGVIFLDEIGDMPLHLQAKLLRVLQDREVIRIGGYTPTKIDVRIIAATHQNLEELIKIRQFREDLFYRLNIIPIVIPPLRERFDDLDKLVYYFVEKYNEKLDKKIIGVNEKFFAKLKAYSWPGNIRELENTIEYAMNIERTKHLTQSSLLPKIIDYHKRQFSDQTLKQRLSYHEERIIKEILTNNKGKNISMSSVASELGLSRASLYRKLNEYDIKID